MDTATGKRDWPSSPTQMGGRIRDFDWRATGLGGCEQWPAHLRTTVEMMLAHGFPMILLWGPRLIQIYNDGYAVIMQDRHPAGLGQPTSECWPEVWHINGPIYERVRQGETVTFADKRYPLVRPEGLQDTWFTITYSPVRDVQGGIEGVLVTMFDTSAAQLARRAREQTERELRESERRLALAFQLLPVGVAIVDPQGQAVMSNEVMRGYLPTDRIPSRDEANVGRWRGWHADGRPVERSDFATARALRGEAVVPGMEFLFRQDDGVERWTQVASAPLRDSNGEVTGALSVVMDIDDLKRNAERLSAKEERFRQFATASSNVLWIRDADTLDMEYLSPAFEQIYGAACDQVLGDVRQWAALVVPDDREMALQRLQRIKAGESIVHEFRIQRPSDGAFRWIRSTDFPLFDAQGRVIRVAGIGVDVTDIRRSSEHQQVLLAELQHRVRNTMAMVGSLVTRTQASAGSVEEYARVLSGRIMCLARTQALLTRAANVGVPMHTLVAEELAAQAHDVSQCTVAGPELLLPPKVTEVISLALHELVTNALKYGALAHAVGRVRVEWEVREQADQSWVALRWEESRPLAPAVPQLTRKGLGSLLIEQRVSYELGGRGELRIEAGGAVALIEFPLQRRASILETQAPMPTQIAGGANDMRAEPGLAGQRILVADDDFYLAHDTASALRSAGAQVLGPFSEACTAIAAMQCHDASCAVIDVNLGSGASFEVAHALCDAGVPFLFLTGYDAAAIPATLAQVPVLHKPADVRHVVRGLSALVRR